MVKLTIFKVIALLSTASGYAIEPKISIAGDTRIVAGNDASQGQFPYQISIRRNANGNHNCGGSIINSKWILTAAHCVVDSSPSDWFIYAGSIFLSGNGITRQVSRIILHPDYILYPSGFNDDIALLELATEIEFSGDVQPVELETEDVGVVDCVVSGWGLLATGDIIPDTLQYVDLTTLTLQQCEAAWPSFFASDREICTPTVNGSGVCTGDSGGPLVANGRQIGIVAWLGIPCGGGNPDVYTKVSAYIDWIEDNIN